LESFEREGFNEGDLEIDLRCGIFNFEFFFVTKNSSKLLKMVWKGKIVE
jgi:hypothetical protein